jgi:phosphoribosylformylglycinamidine synthase I
MIPKALILTGYGINCDYETEHAFSMVGAEAKRVHVNDIIYGIENLEDYQIIAFPGGFSFGDDIASGKVLANKMKFNIFESLKKFIDNGKLIIGICNGFQAMVKMGLIPALNKNYNGQSVTLTFNDSGRFEDRWVYLKGNPNSKCIFTKGIEMIYLPVRHGEGKFVATQEILQRLKKNNHVVFQYIDDKGRLGKYPWNPNGSLENIAGICDETGRIFGMMPHPEAYLHRTNHPRWTREQMREEGMGMKIFRNAIEFIRQEF